MLLDQLGGLLQLAQHHDGAFGDLLDLLQIAAHLFGDRALLLGGGGDVAVHVGDTLYPLHYGGELGTGLGSPVPPLVGLLYALGHQLASLMGIALQLFDHLLDLDGGGLSPVGQLAHFGGHHGKATTCFTGASRFDGGVQCQQVGLFRDAANGVDYRANALDPCSTSLTTVAERWMLPERVSMVLTVSATQRLPSSASWLVSAVA